MSAACTHERCSAVVEIGAIVEYANAHGPDHRVAEITIRCDVCGARARFLGVPGGLAPDRPMCGPFGDELRAPFVFEQAGSS